MSDANFLREIEEDLRRDRLMKLWEKYGVYAVAAAFILIAAVGGWRGWQWHEARESAKAGVRFEQAVTLSDAGKQDEAAKEFAAIAKEAPAGYRMLARLQLAGAAGAKNAAEGVKAFDDIAAHGSIDPVLRELAKMRALFLLVDTAPVADIAARAEPLTAKGAPFHNSAKEALALGYFRAGDRAKARALYAEILADPEVTPSLANRAQVMQALTAEGSPAVPPASPTQ